MIHVVFFIRDPIKTKQNTFVTHFVSILSDTVKRNLYSFDLGNTYNHFRVLNNFIYVYLVPIVQKIHYHRKNN